MTDKASNQACLGAGAKLVIACGSAIALLAFGPRSAMGFFQQPILDTTGWSSATFGLAIAIQNLAWGWNWGPMRRCSCEAARPGPRGSVKK